MERIKAVEDQRRRGFCGDRGYKKKNRKKKEKGGRRKKIHTLRVIFSQPDPEAVVEQDPEAVAEPDSIPAAVKR